MGEASSMSVLALDLGTRCGWAWGDGAGSPPISGTWDLRPGRYDSSSVRLIRFLRHLDELRDSVPVHRVAYEEVRRHMGVDAAHWYGAFWGQLTSWCEARSIPYEGVPVQTIKRHATGKGNAGKDAMLESARARWGRVDDDNAADALWLLDYVRGMGLDQEAQGQGET